MSKNNYKIFFDKTVVLTQLQRLAKFYLLV